MTTTKFTTEYTPGIGWQYVIHRDGVLIGRYGNYDTAEKVLDGAIDHQETTTRNL